METLSTSSHPSLDPQPIRSIQPGGGFCFALERLWGRWRRASLRWLRPDYVRRMQEARQGSCPDCPHDIIDSRDLKLYRNVCGYWFREEEDDFRWRGQLGLARYGLTEVVVFSLLLGGLTLLFGILGSRHHSLYFIPGGITLGLWIFILSFFRDPQREIPQDPNVMVSPADGTITHLEEVEDADFPGGKAFRVSIFLSVFNVHVNRIPCSGTVTAVRYFPGEYLDARAEGCAKRNEQLWIDMEADLGHRPVRIKQIAGAIARRIVCVLKPGEHQDAGNHLGMIKFGSRTDLLLPTDAVREPAVKVGDTVKGGSTLLLHLHPA